MTTNQYEGAARLQIINNPGPAPTAAFITNDSRDFVVTGVANFALLTEPPEIGAVLYTREWRKGESFAVEQRVVDVRREGRLIELTGSAIPYRLADQTLYRRVSSIEPAERIAAGETPPWDEGDV